MNADIGQVILTELKKVVSNSFFDRAPRGAIFPFAVFTTPSSFQGQDKTNNIILEIDLYDNKGNNIATLETYTKNVITAFHKAIYKDAKMLLKFQLESQFQIQETDEQIRRRKLNFLVKYYNREV